jgi:hypothetical protein
MIKLTEGKFFLLFPLFLVLISATGFSQNGDADKDVSGPVSALNEISQLYNSK